MTQVIGRGGIASMKPDAWLNRDEQFEPGREIFRSDRAFSVWAYTVSHSQLLLRSRVTKADGSRQSRIDVLFKPVQGVKTRIDYDGLAIRCAMEDEADQILAETGNTARSLRVLILESQDREDYVVAGAVGWLEDAEDDRTKSRLAFFPPGTDLERILPSSQSQSYVRSAAR
jgi:hypothetical protein